MPIRLIYLDDEDELCQGFAEFMTLMGHEVRTFVDAASTIAACNASPPDVLFLDYRLPDTTGYLVAKQIDPSIPTVLVTGDLAVERSEDFAEILHKPFRLMDAHRLALALGARSGDRE